jgi:hypothetical protein
MKANACSLSDFGSRIDKRLTAYDDPNLWNTAVERIIPEAEMLCDRRSGRMRLFLHIGSCSHWMSPHNKGSWFPDARFAWPTGYVWHRSLIFGLPEFDWFLTWEWITRDSRCEPVSEVSRKHSLVFRVALPARTARHVRAVAHTLWTPGSPTTPKKELLQGYAFAKVNGQWQCVGTSGSDKPYE